MARAPNALSEEQVELLARNGVMEVTPMAINWRIKLKHWLFGCRPIKSLVLDQRIGKVVQIGRICPVCEREFPFA